MFDVLEEVERAIPRLLWQEGWNSLDVDYHDPRVERVWRQWLDYRVSLHVIHPCQPSASLFHPHPWPSAMRVGILFGPSTRNALPSWSQEGTGNEKPNPLASNSSH